MSVLEDEISRTINRLHSGNHRIGRESIERFGFGDADREEIVFEGEIFAGDFEITDIVPLGCINIEDPHVVDTEDTNHNEGQNIGLSETETVIFPGGLPLGEKWEFSALHYQYICIHREWVGAGNKSVLYFLDYSELGAPTSFVLFRLRFGRFDWFFGNFFENGWFDISSGEFVSLGLEIWSKCLFHESVFE